MAIKDIETKERRLSCIQKCFAWINADPTRSQAQLARAINISSSAMCSFLGGTYKGKDDNIIEKLEDFFALENQRMDLLPDPSYINIRQAKKIEQYLSMIHVSKKIGVMYGSSGIGKTMGLFEYKKEHASVFYLPVNPMIRSKGAFFRAVCFTVLGQSWSRGDEGRAFEKLAAHAGTQGALIIIDDAHLLYTEKSTNDSPFEIIRTLNDRGIAFIVCGNDTVRDKVTETNKQEFYQQFASRANLYEVDHYFTEPDVRDVITAVLGEKPREDIFDWLYDMTNKFYGSLRIMVNALQMAAFNATSRNEPLCVAHLEAASSTLISILKHEFKSTYRPKGKQHAQKTNSGEDRESLRRQVKLA